MLLLAKVPAREASIKLSPPAIRPQDIGKDTAAHVSGTNSLTRQALRTSLKNEIIMMDEKTITFFRFIDLRVYDKALDYGKWAMTQLQQPRNEGERYLFNSFYKSACDIALNIAEGSSRSSLQFEHYLRTSKSAIRECLTYTEMCYKLGGLGDIEREQSHELLMELMRMIGALIVSLGRPRRRYDDRDDRGDHANGNEANGDRNNRGDRAAADDREDNNAEGGDSADDGYCGNGELSY